MGRHGVGRIGASATVFLLLLLAGCACPGARAGLTSEYRRHLGSAIDMPLDADIFRPPPGHNAPEQGHHACSHNSMATRAIHDLYPSFRDAAHRDMYESPESGVRGLETRPGRNRSAMFSVCSIFDSSRNLHFV
ncbi:unnamed protein product [Urochloa humidicola]